MASRTALAVPAGALAAVLACTLAGCANPSATCTVRHHYAIVIFQGSAGEDRTRTVSEFRLGVSYGPGAMRWRLVPARITLHAASGANPPLVIKTYWVGHARSCVARLVRARK